MIASRGAASAAGRALRVLATMAMVATAAVAAGATRTIALPPDGMALKPSALPGYAKAQASCGGCHSAEYLAYQPPSAPRAYWEAMVKRMRTVFKAPLDDADVPDIVEYLVRTYGAEQPR